MTVTLEVRGGLSLTFRMPTEADMRGAYAIKPRVQCYNAADDEETLKLFADVRAALASLYVSCSDPAETAESITASALFFGTTGIGLWMELFFRNYRAADSVG